MNRDPIDDALAEIDMLAIAEVVGVYRGGPVELGPDHPSVPDAPEQRARRAVLAKRRAQHVDHVRRYARAFDEQTDGPSPAPEASRRTHANRLARLGFDLDYIARRLGLPPKPRNTA